MPFQVLFDLVLREPPRLAAHPLWIVAAAMANSPLGFILVLVVALPSHTGLCGVPHPGERNGTHDQTAQGLGRVNDAVESR